MWTAVERAYGSVVQNSLRFQALDVAHFELPLILFNRENDQENDQLQRTIWRTLIDKAKFHRAKRPSRNSQIGWSVDQIADFLRNEQTWGEQIGERIQRDKNLKSKFAGDPNLFHRIIAADPPPVPLN